MALSCKQHKMLPLQMEKNVLRQEEELKNQKISLRAGKGKRQAISWRCVLSLSLSVNLDLIEDPESLPFLPFFLLSSSTLLIEDPGLCPRLCFLSSWLRHPWSKPGTCLMVLSCKQHKMLPLQMEKIHSGRQRK